MTSLNSALLVAISGLKSAQTGLSVVSQNVANAQVAGYTAKQAPLASIVGGSTNGGVRTLAIVRSVNQLLLRQTQSARSMAQQLSTQSAALTQFQNVFGQPGNTTNVAAQIANLERAFSALTASPDSATAQAQVVATAQSLAQQFNSVSQSIAQLRGQADSAIATSVNNVNAALAQVYDLNNQIVTLKAQGLSTADLEDERDNEVNAIADEMGVTTSQQANGALYISTASGVSLLDATYDPTKPPLSFTPTPVIGPGAAYYPPPSSSFSSLSGITADGIDITSQIASGNIAGDLAIRDTDLPVTQSQLDELAARVIQSFNGQDLQLFQAGPQTLPSTLSVQDSGGVAAAAPDAPSTITVQSTAGLSVGMTLQFGDQPNTVYQITGLDAATNEVKFAQVGSTTGLTQPVAAGDNLTFGPAVPEFTTATALTAGAGSGTPPGNVITLAGAVGATAGMRIQFAGETTIYTVTSATTNAAGQQQITVQPDGGGQGLSGPVPAGAALSVLPPVSGIAGLAGTITVNPAVIANPWRVRDGTRVQTASPLTGDNALATNIVAMMNTAQNFSANTGLPTPATLGDFAANIVAFQATLAATVSAASDSASTIYSNLSAQFQNQSGVNVDSQLATMISLQNSYSASARVISTIREMMNQLIQMVQ